jgi:hypothetical protein
MDLLLAGVDLLLDKSQENCGAAGQDLPPLAIQERLTPVTLIAARGGTHSVTSTTSR